MMQTLKGSIVRLASFISICMLVHCGNLWDVGFFTLLIKEEKDLRFGVPPYSTITSHQQEYKYVLEDAQTICILCLFLEQ